MSCFLLARSVAGTFGTAPGLTHEWKTFSHMTTLYSTNFDSATPGQPLSGWTGLTIISGDTGAFVASTTSPIHGAGSFAMVAPCNACAMMYGGVTPAADQGQLFCFRCVLSGSEYLTISSLLRGNTSGTTGYCFNPQPLAGTSPNADCLNLLDANGFTMIQSSGSLEAFLGRALVNGDILWFRSEAEGTSIRARLWLDGQTEPSTWLLDVTDGRYASGNAYFWPSATDLTATATIDDYSLYNFTTPPPAPASTTIPASDSRFVYYGRWNSGAETVTVTNGSACEFSYTGQTCTLNFDVSTSVKYPAIAYWIDNYGPTRATLTSSGTIAITPAYNAAPSGSPPFAAVSNSTHRVRFLASLDSEYPTSYDDWDSQRDALKFTGVTIDSGASLLTLPINPNQIEFLGDSITAGLRTLYIAGSTDGVGVNAPEIAWPQYVADSLGLKAVVNGHGGQGITTAATDGTPAANAAFPYVNGTTAYSPANQPVVVWIYQGTNDTSFSQAQYQTYLTTVRAAYPSAFIFAVVPYNVTDTRKTAIQSAVSALADAKVFSLDYSTAFSASDTADGTHFNPGGAVKMGMKAASDIISTLSTVSPSVSSSPVRNWFPGLAGRSARVQAIRRAR